VLELELELEAEAEAEIQDTRNCVPILREHSDASCQCSTERYYRS
jgi:hypothetical protein